jgi:hypothetical protein
MVWSSLIIVSGLVLLNLTPASALMQLFFFFFVNKFGLKEGRRGDLN